MRRVIAALAVAAAIVVLVPTEAVAAGPVVANGGGNGTFDTVAAGSHFGFGVVFGTPASGHFECNMAGNAPFGALHLMAVEGRVTAGVADAAAGTATFSGPGTLHVDARKMDVNFYVVVRECGPGVGTLQLTVTTRAGVLIVAFPAETVMTGQISVH
jgi:hypothetical protein